MSLTKDISNLFLTDPTALWLMQNKFCMKKNGEIIGFFTKGGGSSYTTTKISSVDGGYNWSSVELNDLVGVSGRFVSSNCVVDSNDVVHFLIIDDDAGTVWYWNSLDYSPTDISNGKTTNSFEAAMTVDSADGLHVIFKTVGVTEVELYYRYSSDGGATWGRNESIIDDVTWGPQGFASGMAIACDASNNPHVSWLATVSHGIQYSKRVGTWAARTEIESNACNYLSMIINLNATNQNDVYVTFTDSVDNKFYAIQYDVDGGGWQTKVQISSGDYVGTISIDPASRRIHLAYNQYYKTTTAHDLTALSSEVTLVAGDKNPTFVQNINGAIGGVNDFQVILLNDQSFYRGDNSFLPSMASVPPGSGYGIGDSTNASIDTEYPTVSSFDVTAAGGDNVTVSWVPGSEDPGVSFKEYQIYTSEVSQATVDAKGGDLHNEGTDASLGIRSTTSFTTTSGGTLYVAMFPIDIYGNEAPAGLYSDDSRTAPLVSAVVAIQTDSTTGYVTIEVDVDDSNNDAVKLKVQYSGTASGGTNCTLVGTTVDSISPSQTPLPSISTDTYQIGETEPIDPCTNSNLIFTWDSEEDLGTVNDTYFIGITPIDDTDRVGTEIWSGSFDIDSRPMAPDKPIIEDFTHNTITISQTATTDHSSSTEYAIHVSGGVIDGWVEAGGTIGASRVWQTAAAWASTVVTSFTKLTDYYFFSVERWSSVLSLESDQSEATEITTKSEPPVISGFTVTEPTDGSKNYILDYSLLDPEDTQLEVGFEYWDGAAYQPMINVTGHVGILTEITPIAVAKEAVWNAGRDIPGTTIDTSYIQASVDDTAQITTGTSSTFDIDTADPDLPAGTGISFSAIATDQMTISWSEVVPTSENHFDIYEIYYSTVSQDEANSKIESATNKLWDDSDDAALATRTTSITTVTALEHNTRYYCAFYAKDTFGNYSTLIENNEITLRIYDIDGFVQDDNDYEIPGATVRLYKKVTGYLIAITTSASDGSYNFEVTDDNEYYVISNKGLYGSGIKDSIYGIGR